MSPSSKFFLRGEGKSPLKYISIFLFSIFAYYIEKGLISQLEFGFPFLVCPNSWLQKYQKCCHIGTLEAFYLWTWGISVKAKRLDSHSSPIQLLDFPHLSTNGHSMKPPNSMPFDLMRFMKPILNESNLHFDHYISL